MAKNIKDRETSRTIGSRHGVRDKPVTNPQAVETVRSSRRQRRSSRPAVVSPVIIQTRQSIPATRNQRPQRSLRGRQVQTKAVESNDNAAIVTSIQNPTGGLIHPLLPESDHAIEISVILGTYNRRKLLEACVSSIRAACSAYAYEIVVSDGGSTDGTKEWLGSQPDVVLIQGDLSGAVKAFNDAARVAQGRFIVCLNDDAVLEKTSISSSLPYFDDPFVGQVAMSFCERGVWKIQEALGKPYGNFPVTRASIVRAAEKITGGIWANCYRTYGGDNELSCWVHRLGYRVVAAPNCRVRHLEHVDELRSRNHSLDFARNEFAKRWPSPDILRFRGPRPTLRNDELAAMARIEAGELPSDRWHRIAAVDPNPGSMPPSAAPLRGERVLHWHLFTEDDPQRSLADSFKTIGGAGYIRVDWPCLRQDRRSTVFLESCQALRPTLIFLQLQDPNALPVDVIRKVRSAGDRDPSLVICAWSGDVGPTKGPWPHMNDDWQYDLAPHIDLMLFTGTGQVLMHRERGMKNAAYLQIGYDTDRYYPGPDAGYGKRHSVVFLGQDYGQRFDAVPHNEAGLRRSMVDALRHEVPGFAAYGGGFGPSLPQKLAGDVYRESAVAVSISLTSSLGRYTSDRAIRAMACGCPTAIKRFNDMEGMGLVSGINCIVWDTVADLVKSIRHWLHPSQRQQLREIGRQGAELMNTHHTWENRVRELASIVNAIRGQRK